MSALLQSHCRVSSWYMFLERLASVSALARLPCRVSPSYILLPVITRVKTGSDLRSEVPLALAVKWLKGVPLYF